MRRGELIFNLFLAWGPPLALVFFMVFVHPLLRAPIAYTAAAIAVLLLGGTLVTVAKVSVIRKSRPVSWGSQNMTAAYRWCYRIGYALFGIGLMMAVNAIMALRFLYR